MIKKLLPVILAIFGLAAGLGAGLMLRPEPAPETMADKDMTQKEEKAPKEEEDTKSSDYEYVKMNNQFVIPDIADGKVTALLVMSLSLEVEPGNSEAVYSLEPKLRDAFLQVLFDHANLGGFRGDFTNHVKMDDLRMALLEVAHKQFGPPIKKILITEIVRQDIN